jgi:2-keto-4-pentenoate hydratase/2-oxohepta-3-ene-1,7-dioic acid hydratase in catechol pathway
MFSTGEDATPRLGIVADGDVVDLQAVQQRGGPPFPRTLGELIGAGLSEWERVSRYLASELASGRMHGARHKQERVRWHAPIPRPGKNIFCVGRNYLGHAEEAARAAGTPAKVPEVPMFFTKAPTAVIGPFDDVPWHQSVTQQLDWEAELAVVVGIAGRDVSREQALRHVFGYTVTNDVTARDVQKRHGQFFKGKSLDGSCPIGPSVVTADEFGDPHTKAITLRVNGVVKQQGNTRDMIFRVDALIESLSQGLTIEPGDIIATGTPDGVGFARTPPEFLQVGDVMETEVEGVGTMRNRIVAQR